MSQFQTKVNRFEKRRAIVKNYFVCVFACRRDPILASDYYLCDQDGPCAGARGKSTKIIKVPTTDAKKWWQRSEYVFHLHFHVEGATMGSNRVLMFERQTEIFLF